MEPLSPRPRLASRGWLALPVTVGVLLRLTNLRPQILGGDELHAVRAALEMPLSEILITYRVADHCIPLTALYRFLMDRGVVLDELPLRLPSLVSGVLLLIVAPAVLESRVGRAAAVLFAWLLAISPVLFFYSRVVRSYVPLALLSFAAVAVLERWLRTRSWRDGAGYVAVASLAVYLHLAAAPFVLSQFLFALGSDLAGRPHDQRRNLGSILLLYVAVAVAVGLFLIPAWSSLEPVITAVGQRSSPAIETFVGVAKLQAGTARPLLVIAFFAAAAAGLIRLLGTESRLAAHTLVVAVGQTVGVWVLSPLYLQFPLMFGRYVIPLLPWLLLWAAIGLATPWWSGQRLLGSILQRGAAYGVVTLLFLTGPLTDANLWSSPFAHHNDFIAFYRSRGTMSEADIPAFYRGVREHQVAGPILEYPFHTSWKFSRALRIYQEFHGREVLVSTPERAVDDPRLELRNMVRPQARDFLKSRARTVVVHLDSGAELARIHEATGLPSADESLMASVSQELRAAGARMAESLEQAWGPPFYSDGIIQVWDLEAIRARDH